MPTRLVRFVTTLCISGVTGCAARPVTVEQYGAMRAVMRDGQTEGRLALTGSAADPGAVAVGALQGLAGEITIVDGETWTAHADGETVVVNGPAPDREDEATLLTLALVSRWRTVPLDSQGVESGVALEALIERTARATGVDTTVPFPFVIDGMAGRLAIHVVNGYCPIATNPASVGAEPWRWSAEQPVEAKIVGFYAPGAAGVMTHHGTSIHAHAVLRVDQRTITGHVDRMSFPRGATLRVPAS